MEELRQKLETVQNTAETDQRQLVQSNEDIENLKKKLEDTEKNVSEKEASLRTSKQRSPDGSIHTGSPSTLDLTKFLAQEKLRKVLTAFKAEKSQLETLNEKLETANSDLEIEKDKYSKTREAQKLAEVKVMELEQRLTTLTAKAKEAEDAKGMISRIQPSGRNCDISNV